MNRKSLIITALIIPAMVLMSGCARKIKINTTTYADSNIIPNGFEKRKSFCLDGDVYLDEVKQHNNDLETKELKKKISFTLENKGYSVTDKSIADYSLFFNYACNRKTITYDVLRYTPGPTYTTNATLTGSTGRRFFNSQYKETTTTPGTFYWTPEKTTYFAKGLGIRIYENNGKKELEEIWKGTSYGVDEYNDSRTFVDFLLVSTFNSFGKSGETNTTTFEDNEAVNSLRKQMSGESI